MSWDVTTHWTGHQGQSPRLVGSFYGPTHVGIPRTESPGLAQFRLRLVEVKRALIQQMQPTFFGRYEMKRTVQALSELF